MSSVDQRVASRPIVVAPVSAIIGVLVSLGVVQIKNTGETAIKDQVTEDIKDEIEVFREQNTTMVATVTRIESSAGSAAEDIKELKEDFKNTNSEMLKRFDQFLDIFAKIKPEVTANTGRSIRNERDIDRINTKIEQLHQSPPFGIAD